MGTCYYLIRRDTRTGYDLGKAWFLRHVFGGRYGQDGTPMQVTLADVETLVDLILAAKRGDLDLAYDVSVHRGPWVEDADTAYWREVAIDVVDWAEGQPFEFCSEHDGLYEETSMHAWGLVPWQSRLWRTGDRHDAREDDREDGRPVRWEHAHRVELAHRRHADEAFRRGNVWIDGRTGVEVVQTTPSMPSFST